MDTCNADIGALIKSCTELKSYFEKVRDDIEAERKALADELSKKTELIEQRVAEKEKQVDRFLQEAMPEIRYVQDITIGGSKDFFYPVWFRMPTNEHGNAKITFCRHYSWNEDTRPLDPSVPHQAALLLDMEGNAYGWDGDANFLEIKRFHERYNPTVSHVAFLGYSKWRNTGTTGTGLPQDTLCAGCVVYSTVYLRGGGLTYRIIKNWRGDVQFSDKHDRVNIYVSESHGTWYVEPIPFAQYSAPKQTTNAFVDPV